MDIAAQIDKELYDYSVFVARFRRVYTGERLWEHRDFPKKVFTTKEMVQCIKAQRKEVTARIVNLKEQGEPSSL